jgi:hypothetical protein
MPVIFQDVIRREDLRAHPDRLYLFGDNEARAGKGRGAGQAGECRGEPNAVGVATKRRPSMEPGSFWSDDDFERCAAIIDRDLQRAFEHAKAGGLVVVPRSGIGTGRSELPIRAPRLMEHIRGRLREMMKITAA